MNLFQQLHTEHIVPAEPYGHWPGALDIGVAPIALPAGFDPRLPNQNLPLNLWNEIHDTFLTNNPPLLQFLNAVP
jgi:hypothetical protein